MYILNIFIKITNSRIYFTKYSKIDIICPEHGIFQLVAANHIKENKGKCPKCTGQHLTKENFLKRCKEKFNNMTLPTTLKSTVNKVKKDTNNDYEDRLQLTLPDGCSFGTTTPTE